MTDSKHKKSQPTDPQSSVKDTLQSVLIALILAFVFRAYVVEAFVIPTGSMAPTLLGEHARVMDPSSGYTFSVDLPDGAQQQWQAGPGGQRQLIRSPRTLQPLNVDSPMTMTNVTLPSGTSASSGDRILVHKYIYNFIEPRRWDVAVFKAPHEPTTNYIKRVVGLPNEWLYLLDGNVYTSSDEGETWHIARKTDPQANRHWEAVQRAVWQPIYNSNYIPLDAETGLAQQTIGPATRWKTPWQPIYGNWNIEGQRQYELNGDNGSIAFDFRAVRANHWQMEYPYNQLNPMAEPPLGFTPIEDIRLATNVMPREASSRITLSTTARLADHDGPIRRLHATVQADGQVKLALSMPEANANNTQVIASTQISSLSLRRATTIELWYVDQEAIVWVDGRVALRHRWDWPFDVIIDWPAAENLPSVRIDVEGGPITLSQVKLDRDLYYTSISGNALQARGGLVRERGELRSRNPVQLGADDFYCLGDNSPASKDSRFWEWDPDNNRDHALVEYLMWNQPGNYDGLVHRNMLIGRAFMVYFPAPLWNGWIPAPNFAKLRFIR